MKEYVYIILFLISFCFIINGNLIYCAHLVPADYFGLHGTDVYYPQLHPEIINIGIRLYKQSGFAINPSLDIEDSEHPCNASFNWAFYDNFVQFCSNNNINIIFEISPVYTTPIFWPPNQYLENNYRNGVACIMNRYSNPSSPLYSSAVKYYSIGNEMNNKRNHTWQFACKRVY